MINHLELSGQWLGEYIAAGADIPYKGRVLRQNTNVPSPATGVFATVLLMRAEVRGTNFSDGWREQRFDKTMLDTVEYSAQVQTYSIQFYRQGAMNAASRFRLWTTSAAGLEHMERMGVPPQWATDSIYIVGDLVRATYTEMLTGIARTFVYRALQPSGPGLAALAPGGHPKVWEAVAETERLFGASFIKVSNVRRLDGIIHSSWEERCGLDLTIGVIDSLGETAPLIQSGVIDVISEEGTDTIDYSRDT